MDKKRKQIISTNITKYRKEHGITQKELAQAIDIKPSTLSDYINLRSAPSHGVIQKIADYFAVNKSDIDTTYKDFDNSITEIYNQLDQTRQKKLYQLASYLLQEQNDKSVDGYAVFKGHPEAKLSAKELKQIKSLIKTVGKESD